MKQNEALRILAECERGLRKLVADAASEGNYADVTRIADMARAVGALAIDARSTDELVLAPVVGSDAAFSVAKAVVAKMPPSSRVRRDVYPKFFRRGNELVKVGWSKSAKEEYGHRAPSKAVELVAAAVRQAGAKGRLFNGDALLPLQDPANGSPVPDYQAYVALAWLKHLGIVEQRGRRAGYVLVPSKQIDAVLTVGWAELGEWRG